MMIKLIAFSCLLAVALAGQDSSARTKSLENKVNGDGSYSWQYETDNDIFAQEAGVGGVSAQGTARWYAKDGTAIHFTYTADQNGYHPVGEHLPTPPPTPAYILRALEYLKKYAPERPDEKL